MNTPHADTKITARRERFQSHPYGVVSPVAAAARCCPLVCLVTSRRQLLFPPEIYQTLKI